MRSCWQGACAIWSIRAALIRTSFDRFYPIGEYKIYRVRTMWSNFIKKSLETECMYLAVALIIIIASLVRLHVSHFLILPWVGISCFSLTLLLPHRTHCMFFSQILQILIWWYILIICSGHLKIQGAHPQLQLF